MKTIALHLATLALAAGAPLAVAGASTTKLPRYDRPTSFGWSSVADGSATVGGAIATADFNQDGLVDVVFSRALSSQATFPLGFLTNNGHRRLVEAPSSLFVGPPPQTQDGRDIVVADFNNDGRPDVYYPDSGEEVAPDPPGYHDTLILSTSAGKLVDATTNIPRQADFTHSAAAADIDLDGDIDLFVGNIGGNAGYTGNCCSIQIWVNDGQGRFTIAPGRLPPEIEDGNQNTFTASAFADVDGDGSVDLILGGAHGCVLPTYSITNATQLLVNDGTGHFQVRPGSIPPKPFGVSSETLDIKAVDLNRDRALDLLVASTNAPQETVDCYAAQYRARHIQVLINGGDGTFRDETAQRLPVGVQDLAPTSFDYINHLQLADLNGDGAAEIVTLLIVPPWGDDTSDPIYLNDGGGVFRRLPLGYGVLRAHVHAPVDFDGDGGRDLFLISHPPGRFDAYAGRRQAGRPIRATAPSDVRVTKDPFTGRLVVAWPYVWGGARYEVWRSTSAARRGARIGTTRRMRLVDRTAVLGRTYYYSVRAVSRAGVSGFGRRARSPE